MESIVPGAVWRVNFLSVSYYSIALLALGGVGALVVFEEAPRERGHASSAF